jgi:3-deoxy-D-arabino-heptulosonate 7-phosphate (DAHP) synthase class II
MQTFLPYPDFVQSARVLDRQRLGKQRVETLQIMKALHTGVGWVNHPATKMWAGHECALLDYQTAVCDEWTSRGYKDTCLQKTSALHFEYCTHHVPALPAWIGDPEFHRAHRSNLLRKLPHFYRTKFETYLEENLPYIWK